MDEFAHETGGLDFPDNVRISELRDFADAGVDQSCFLMFARELAQFDPIQALPPIETHARTCRGTPPQGYRPAVGPRYWIFPEIVPSARISQRRYEKVVRNEKVIRAIVRKREPRTYSSVPKVDKHATRFSISALLVIADQGK